MIWNLLISILPLFLRVFLTTLFASKDFSILVGFIGQSIMQQLRPKTVVTPLQIVLAVQMHKHFGFKFLVDSIYSHGFSFWYSKIQKNLNKVQLSFKVQIYQISKKQVSQCLSIIQSTSTIISGQLMGFIFSMTWALLFL